MIVDNNIDDLIKMIDHGDRLPTPDEAEDIIEALEFYKEVNNIG